MRAVAYDAVSTYALKRGTLGVRIEGMAPEPRVPEEDTMTTPAIAHMTWGKLNFCVLEITGYRTVVIADDFVFRVADARCRDTDTGHYFDLSLPLDEVTVEN